MSLEVRLRSGPGSTRSRLRIPLHERLFGWNGPAFVAAVALRERVGDHKNFFSFVSNSTRKEMMGKSARSVATVATPGGVGRRLRLLRAAPAERLHLILMLALTFSTGLVDAIGYLGLDRVFTGNMTGNVVVLGMAITGGGHLPVIGPLLALLGFIAGAALAGWGLRGTAPGWLPRTTAFLTLAALLVLTAGVALVCIDGYVTAPTKIFFTTILGSAMGLQAVSARHIAVRDVTTVVVTSTITAFAAILIRGTRRGGSLMDRRLAAVVLILVGAAIGAALLQWQLGAGLILAGTILAVVATVGAWHAGASTSAY